ncbi:hypothetical protein V5O48_004357 [Marasmius crinis-equi]|uniref:Uncharacterized protein n=1 Tax=Marasmius crinis-equi TaxID=585013 RepID=A0ABR3FQA8_9AGAR
MSISDRRGTDPSQLIGKVLTRARRSADHPALTLDFSDSTSYQVLVDGYNPRQKGVPKELEMDDSFDNILLSNDGFIGLEIIDCAIITLSDKAFERKQIRSQETDLRWDKHHLGVAFKFAGENPRWHCVWATLKDYDKELGDCIFRSYNDVYLKQLQRSPQAADSLAKGYPGGYVIQFILSRLALTRFYHDYVASLVEFRPERTPLSHLSLIIVLDAQQTPAYHKQYIKQYIQSVSYNHTRHSHPYLSHPIDYPHSMY